MTGFERHRRSGRIIANFTGFEADLLRSLASQLVELLRDEVAAPTASDPLEAMFDFTGPTTAPEDPVLARLFPDAYHGDEEAAGSSGVSPRAPCAAARRTRPSRSSMISRRRAYRRS